MYIEHYFVYISPFCFIPLAYYTYTTLHNNDTYII